jgi:hypothetical protein
MVHPSLGGADGSRPSRKPGFAISASPTHVAHAMLTARGEYRNTRKPTVLQIVDVARLAEALAGVRRTTADGLAQWRYHGRLVARQLDDIHLVIRSDFDDRDSLLRQFPDTFRVPARYRKHMMVVADLAGGDAGAIEDALEAAWLLQRRAD